MINKITIQHVDKFDGPFIGYYNENGISVLNKLTAPERAFVVAHEYYHSQDTSEWSRRFWWWGELKATVLPLIGFVMVVFRKVFNLKGLLKYIGQKGSR